MEWRFELLSTRWAKRRRDSITIRGDSIPRKELGNRDEAAFSIAQSLEAAQEAEYLKDKGRE